MTDVGLSSLGLEKEHWLHETPKDQQDELWPPPLWPGHFCRRSFLQLRDSSGLAAQQPPYSFAVRYDLRPLSKQMSGISAYLMLMDGESLRRIGKGSGLDLVAAAKSWIARHALCAPPQLLAKDADGKLTGEVVAQPDPHLYGNGEGVLLMSVVLTADLKDWRDWRPVGDLMSYRLGSPPVQCGLCGMAVAQRDLVAHQKECLEVMIPCPRCGKRVLIRELSAHQKGRDCVSQLVMSTQTEAMETEDVGSQCVTAAMLPVAVQTSYASVLVAPSLRAEEPVPALVPSVFLRWPAPPSAARRFLTEYQLTVSEFMGGDERWKHLRVELLDLERLERGVQGATELRHELSHLRPGTRYRLELQLRAVDGCLGPKAQVTVQTPSRLAGFEGLSEDERLHLASAMVPTGPAQRPESLSVREQATQAGPGFVTGACKSEISREIGVQAFPKIFTETACQIDTVAAVKETACGAEWPSLTSCGVQCKAGQRDATSQSEVKLADHSCQAQFPARPYTGDQKAELEMDLHSGVPGWREVLQQSGFSQLLRLVLVLLGNATALAGMLLAELPAQEMWPMLASLIVLLPFNALELLFFQTFPPSRRSATKLRIWKRRHPNMNMLIQAAIVFVSPDALHLYRAPMQPGGRRFTGVVGPQPESPLKKVPGTSELCAAKCPMCSQLSPIPRMADLWRSSRFLLYCHLPQLVLAILLLIRRMGLTSDLDVGRVALHGFTSLAHGVSLLWILGHWIQYRFRRRSQKLKVSDLVADLEFAKALRILRLTWSGMEEVLCEAWFVVFHSFDRKNILRIEMLEGKGMESDGLQLEGIPPGHFWVSVLSYHRTAGLSMPLAMGHCEIPADEEDLKLRNADSGVDAQTETVWEAKDVGTDPLHLVPATADAEVQNVAASVDAVTQWPAVPVERVDASTCCEESSSSDRRLSAVGTAVEGFDLPVQLRLEDHFEASAPEASRGLWLTWAPHGLQELAPRLVAKARHVSGAGLVDAAMSVNRASFQLEAGRYELLLSCELGLGQAEVQLCPHPRCGQAFWAQHLQAHLSRCPWQPQPCPRASKGCLWMGCSDEVAAHEADCVAMEVECKNQAMGCKWVGPAIQEASHLQECPPQRLLDVVQPLEALLNEACPDYRNPETVRLLQQCVQYRRYVRPCGQWKEWKSSGRCCDCSKVIDRKEKGLQCENPSLRLCWSCMPNRMDWQRLKEEAKVLPKGRSQSPVKGEASASQT